MNYQTNAEHTATNTVAENNQNSNQRPGGLIQTSDMFELKKIQRRRLQSARLRKEHVPVDSQRKESANYSMVAQHHQQQPN